MSRSNKARHGTRCQRWKDTVLASRAQAAAWSTRKRIETQRERARDKRRLRDDLDTPS